MLKLMPHINIFTYLLISLLLFFFLVQCLKKLSHFTGCIVLDIRIIKKWEGVKIHDVSYYTIPTFI